MTSIHDQRKTIALTRWTFVDTRDNSIHEHHEMVSTEIRLIIFFATEDGEAVYSKQKQDITLPTKVRLVKAMVFLVGMYGCES